MTAVTVWLCDVRAALAVWRRTPVLPVLAVAIAVATFGPSLLAPSPPRCGTVGHPACSSGNEATYLLVGLLALPVTVYSIGFFGAERWWYAQVSAGATPRARQLWRVGWSYFWRYVRLGLVTLVLGMPVAPFLYAVRHSTTRTSVALGVWAFALDIAFTFVTPALAFSTTSAWSAIRIGATTLNRLWPRDWVYALIPPLALTILARLIPHALGSKALTAGVGAAAQLISTLFAGATALLYLREIDPQAAERLRYGPASRRRGPNNALDRWQADDPWPGR